MCLDATKEIAIRTALKAKIAAVTGTDISGVTSGDNVFETPYYFASREDFAATVGIDGSATIKALEIRFVQLAFLNFIDTGQGTDQCPTLQVNYNVFMFQQFIQIRKDEQGSRPYNDYVAWVMNMMRAFFVNRQITAEASITLFSQPEFIAAGQYSIYLPDVKGIFTSLRATLEVT
jgi:hypothetical protein